MRTVTRTLQVLMVSLLLIPAFQSNAQVTLFTEGWETAGIGQTPPAGWAVDLVSRHQLHLLPIIRNIPHLYPLRRFHVRRISFMVYWKLHKPFKKDCSGFNCWVQQYYG